MAHPPPYKYNAGLGNSGAFTGAGIPFVSGGIDASSTTRKVNFPSVTQWVVVSCARSAECKVGFSANGVGGTNYMIVPSGSLSPRLQVKVTELYIGGPGTNVSVMAGLSSVKSTSIDSNALSPDGTNWSGSTAALVG